MPRIRVWGKNADRACLCPHGYRILALNDDKSIWKSSKNINYNFTLFFADDFSTLFFSNFQLKTMVWKLWVLMCMNKVNFTKDFRFPSYLKKNLAANSFSAVNVEICKFQLKRGKSCFRCGFNVLWEPVLFPKKLSN